MHMFRASKHTHTHRVKTTRATGGAAMKDPRCEFVVHVQFVHCSALFQQQFIVEILEISLLLFLEFQTALHARCYNRQESHTLIILATAATEAPKTICLSVYPSVHTHTHTSISADTGWRCVTLLAVQTGSEVHYRPCSLVFFSSLFCELNGFFCLLLSSLLPLPALQTLEFFTPD